MFCRIGNRVTASCSLGSWLPIVDYAPGNGKRIALTIDDGPSPAATPAILKLLEQHKATAAFFLCGQRIEAHPELTRAIVTHGHRVYAHGYSHVRIDALSEAAALDEIVRTEELISRFRSSPSPYLVRLPYGSGHGEVRIHRLLRRWRSDCQIAHWSCNPEDFRLADGCSTRSELEEKCGRAVVRMFSDPKISGKAILMHDDPIGALGAFANDVARIFLSKILTMAAERQFAIAGFEPASNNAWMRRYVRPWIKY
jgi:peptidoglycan/xylan/chitin deacetylase (PgdA/CDA1 family)